MIEIEQAVEDRVKAENPGKRLTTLTNDVLERQIIVRSPTSAEWKMFKAQQASDETRPVAMRTLLVLCTVYPARDDLNAFLEEYPGAVETFGPELLKFAGVNDATRAKKL